MIDDHVTLDEAREILVAAARQRQQIMRKHLQRIRSEGRFPDEALRRLAEELEASCRRDIFMAQLYAGESIRD